MALFKKHFADHITAAIRKSPEGMPPAFGEVVCVRAVGGLRAVGFTRDRDHLIIVSSTGQGVLDCETGRLVHRDRAADGVDRANNRARNLAQPDEPPVDLAGIDGGALMRVASDGWSARLIYVDWPWMHAIIEPPGASIDFVDPKWRKYNKDARFFRIYTDEEPVAFGFSWTGRSLVWADTSQVIVWRHNMAGAAG